MILNYVLGPVQYCHFKWSTLLLQTALWSIGIFQIMKNGAKSYEMYCSLSNQKKNWYLELLHVGSIIITIFQIPVTKVAGISIHLYEFRQINCVGSTIWFVHCTKATWNISKISKRWHTKLQKWIHWSARPTFFLATVKISD